MFARTVVVAGGIMSIATIGVLVVGFTRSVPESNERGHSQSTSKPDQSGAGGENGFASRSQETTGQGGATHFPPIAPDKLLRSIFPLQRLENACRVMGIDRSFLEKECLEFARRVSLLARKKVTKDILRHDPERGIFAFRLPAFPEGEEELNLFRETLVKELGEENAKWITEQLLQRYKYGSLGRVELLVRFQRNARGDFSWEADKYIPRSPSGRPAARSIGYSFEQFTDKHGFILGIEDEMPGD